MHMEILFPKLSIPDSPKLVDDLCITKAIAISLYSFLFLSFAFEKFRKPYLRFAKFLNCEYSKFMI